MTDEHRRRATDTLESRVSVLEVEMRTLITQLDRHMVKTEELIMRLDARADHMDLSMGRLGAGLAVVIALVNLFAPSVARLLGLP